MNVCAAVGLARGLVLLSAIASCVDLGRPAALAHPDDAAAAASDAGGPDGGGSSERAAPSPDGPVVSGDGPGAPPPGPEAGSADQAAPPREAAAPPADASAPDGPRPSTPDARPDAAPAALCTRFPNALFCEDFEGGTIPMDYPRYYPITVSGTVAISGAQVWRGKGALRATVTQNPPEGFNNARLVRKFAAPVAQGTLHVRAYLYLKGGFQVTGAFVLLNAYASDTEKVSYDLAPQGRIELSMTVAPYFRQGGLLPRDRWFCAETVVQIGPSGGNGYAEVFIDGQSQVRSPAGTNTLPGNGGYVALSFGADYVKGLTADGEVFVDDVVVATTPIGCD
jgi:hypothetical protein